MNSFCLSIPARTGLVAAAALLLHACAPAQEEPTPTVGVDVSRYLAVGDTYTAGFSAGGLTRASQEYSFPNLLARQLRGAVPGMVFTQPLLEAGTGSGYLELVGFNATGVARSRRVAGQAVRRTYLNTTACGGTDTVRVLARNSTAGMLPHNLGVPGLFLSQIESPGLGNEANLLPSTPFNPYFERLLPAADNRTYLQAVTEAAGPATFFTYFQGLDNLLPYVRSGGQCGPLPSLALTTLLRNNAKKVLDRLTAGGRRGIIAKLPDLNTLPLLRLGRGLGLQMQLHTDFNDKNILYIEDPIGIGAAQPITDDDYVLATTIPRVGKMTPVTVGGTVLMLPYGRDSRNPLLDADVLDKDELSRINGVLTSYNNELDRLATDVYKMPAINPANKGALDLTSLFGFLPSGITVGGVVYSTQPVRGNFFSLDYYSLTPRGNALLANAFIAGLNKAYRANIPALDVNSLPTTAQ